MGGVYSSEEHHAALRVFNQKEWSFEGFVIQCTKIHPHSHLREISNKPLNNLQIPRPEAESRPDVKPLKCCWNNQHFSLSINKRPKTAAKMNTDAKLMFLVNGISPLPFSSGWTGRICRETDIQGMVKTQCHQKHSALIIINSPQWLSGDKEVWRVTMVPK